MKKKLLAMFLAAATAVSLLGGCGNQAAESGTDKGSAADEGGTEAEASDDTATGEEAQGGDAADTAEAAEFAGYPVDTDEVLTLWTNQIKPSSTVASWEESPFHTTLAEMTGIDIDYTFPASGTDEGQAFNLMISDSNLPDMIWYSFMGDAESYIEDGILRDLTDLLPKYAPNYWKFLQENPYYDKSLKTDSGKYYGFGFFRESRWQSVYHGPMVRKDWLDECGLPVPETIEDWETTIRAFNDKYGAKFAFTPNWRVSPGMAGAFGAYGTVDLALYVDDNNKLQIAQMQNEWKDYMAWLNKLNNEGLLDPDIVTLDDTGLRTKVANGQVGITNANLTGLNNFILDAQSNGNGANWVGCPYPVMNKGDKTCAIFCEDPVVPIVAGITTSCPEEKVELALRWLDYPFSEEGFVYWNFGTEGVSYEMVDGEPHFTDLILKSELGAAEAAGLYTGEGGWGCGIQALGMVQQKLDPKVVEAGDLWYYGNEEAGNWTYPSAVTMTPDESTESSTIYNSINTYVKEMALKFITGEESLDNFDAFIQTLNDMGAERMLEIRQAAYDRFLAR